MVFERIRAIVAEQMNITEEKITANTSFMDDLGADSLDLFQIVSELEEAFDMEISSDSIKKIKTIGDATQFIKKVLE